MLLFGKKSRIKILIDQNDLFSLFHFYFNVLFVNTHMNPIMRLEKSNKTY